MADEFSRECLEIISLLSTSKNVLISGPPGTGKTRLLSEVANAFSAAPALGGGAQGPAHDPEGDIPVPAGGDIGGGPVVPALGKDRTERAVFRSTFHQSSKHRDFVSGLLPVVKKTPGDPDFRVVKGQLLKAAEHALGPNGASLLIIDEINRGPAVQIFGGSIVAMEANKRLAPDNSVRMETQFFEIMNPDDGEIIEFALPHHLYVLAAMNQADASVEPLDVAFLRRWEPYKLNPDISVLRSYMGSPGGADLLPEVPASASDVFEACIRAWIRVNERISLGRGEEFQVGHGVLMPLENVAGVDQMVAQNLVAQIWDKIRAHIEEVFFGDLRGVAAVLNITNGPDFHPLKLIETTFADDLRLKIEGPDRFSSDDIYNCLRAVAEE